MKSFIDFKNRGRINEATFIAGSDRKSLSETFDGLIDHILHVTGDPNAPEVAEALSLIKKAMNKLKLK